MAVTTSVGTPTLDQVVARAEALLPRLRERARTAEVERHVPTETVEDLCDAGLFRVLQPTRYGGYELDYGLTQVELCHVLGQACGSTAWVQCVVACHAWCLAMFPPEAQDAVWGQDQDTLIASAFAFKTGRGQPVEGGYRVEGEWQFSSGSDICQWIILGTPIYEDGAERPSRVIWALLPRQEWEILDTWYAAGLKASATNDIRLPGAFVPTDFTLEIGQCDGRPTPGSAINPSPMYSLPVWPVFPYNVSTPALGVARGALDAYLAYMGERPDRANMIQRQLRIGESAAEVDAALALLRSDSAELSEVIRTGQTLSPDFQARARRDTSFAVQLCVRAVDRLAAVVGAHGMLDDTPVQRAFRDVHAIANHAANSFDITSVAYARHALGLPPLPAF